jgi:hypothetical protein
MDPAHVAELAPRCRLAGRLPAHLPEVTCPAMESYGPPAGGNSGVQARGKRNCFARYDLASLAVEEVAGRAVKRPAMSI